MEYIPNGLISLPNKENWFAPEQLKKSISDIKNYWIWFVIALLFNFINGFCNGFTKKLNCIIKILFSIFRKKNR